MKHTTWGKIALDHHISGCNSQGRTSTAMDTIITVFQTIQGAITGSNSITGTVNIKLRTILFATHVIPSYLREEAAETLFSTIIWMIIGNRNRVVDQHTTLHF